MNAIVGLSPEARPMLDVAGLAHSFGGLQVLTDVSFDVGTGGIVGLIGPNGSGKTTIFNIVSGFLRQKAGSITLSGEEISDRSVQRRCRAGLLRTFQTPKVFEHMTVLENVMTGAHPHTSAGFLATMLRLPAARAEFVAARSSALEVLARFGIERLADARAGKLPAGQRRVVELARAYHARPRILLLDEPSSGLSTDEVEELRAWIRMLADEGMTILLVSHDMGLMAVCDRVHVLYFGRIIASGTMDEVREDPRVREAYLGS